MRQRGRQMLRVLQFEVRTSGLSILRRVEFDLSTAPTGRCLGGGAFLLTNPTFSRRAFSTPPSPPPPSPSGRGERTDEAVENMTPDVGEDFDSENVDDFYSMDSPSILREDTEEAETDSDRGAFEGWAGRAEETIDGDAEKGLVADVVDDVVISPYYASLPEIELVDAVCSYLRGTENVRLVSPDEEALLFPALLSRIDEINIDLLLDVVACTQWRRTTDERYGLVLKDLTRDRILREISEGSAAGGEVADDHILNRPQLIYKSIVVMGISAGRRKRDLDFFSVLGRLFVLNINHYKDSHDLVRVMTAFNRAKIIPPPSFLALIGRRLPVLSKRHPLHSLAAYRVLSNMHRFGHDQMNPFRFLADRMFEIVYENLKQEKVRIRRLERAREDASRETETASEEGSVEGYTAAGSVLESETFKNVKEGIAKERAEHFRTIALRASESGSYKGLSTSLVDPDALADFEEEPLLAEDSAAAVRRRFLFLSEVRPQHFTKMLLILARFGAPHQQYLRPLIAPLLLPSIPYFPPPSFSRLIRAMRLFKTSDSPLFEGVITHLVYLGTLDGVVPPQVFTALKSPHHNGQTVPKASKTTNAERIKSAGTRHLVIADVMEVLRMLALPDSPIPQISKPILKAFILLCYETFSAAAQLRARFMIIVASDLLLLIKRIVDLRDELEEMDIRRRVAQLGDALEDKQEIDEDAVTDETVAEGVQEVKEQVAGNATGVNSSKSSTAESVLEDEFAETALCYEESSVQRRILTSSSVLAALSMLLRLVERFAQRLCYLIDIRILSLVQAEILEDTVRQIQLSCESAGLEVEDADKLLLPRRGDPEPDLETANTITRLRLKRHAVNHSEGGDEGYYAAIDIDVRSVFFKIQFVDTFNTYGLWRPIPGLLQLDFQNALVSVRQLSNILEAAYLYDCAYPGEMKLVVRRLVSQVILERMAYAMRTHSVSVEGNNNDDKHEGDEGGEGSVEEVIEECHEESVNKTEKNDKAEKKTCLKKKFKGLRRLAALESSHYVIPLSAPPAVIDPFCGGEVMVDSKGRRLRLHRNEYLTGASNVGVKEGIADVEELTPAEADATVFDERHLVRFAQLLTLVPLRRVRCSATGWLYLLRKAEGILLEHAEQDGITGEEAVREYIDAALEQRPESSEAALALSSDPSQVETVDDVIRLCNDKLDKIQMATQRGVPLSFIEKESVEEVDVKQHPEAAFVASAAEEALDALTPAEREALVRNIDKQDTEVFNWRIRRAMGRVSVTEGTDAQILDEIINANEQVVE